MHDLLNGATYPFRAIAYLARMPRLWRYVAIPIILNIVIAATLYASLLATGFGAIDRFIADSSFSGVIEGFLRLLLGFTLLLLTGFLLVRFGVVLGSPWYGRLSEELETAQLGHAPPAEPLTALGIGRDLWRALTFELKKLLLFLVVGGLLLLVNFLPVAGQIIDIVGWTLLGAVIACLDFFDSPLERRRLRFREKLGAIRRAMPASLAFGLVSFGLVSIPFVNLLSIPLCVAAGTLFFCDYIQREVPTPSVVQA